MEKTLEERVGALEAAQFRQEESNRKMRAHLTRLNEQVTEGFTKVAAQIADIHRDMDGSFKQNSLYQKEQDTRAEEHFRRVDERFNAVDSRLTHLEADVATLKTDVATLKTDVAALKTDMGEVKAGLAQILARLPDPKQH